MSAVTFTFHTPAEYDDEGEPLSWEQLGQVEIGDVTSITDEEVAIRQQTEDGPFEWEAYAWDFGGAVGRGWAYGSSADLLVIRLNGAPVRPDNWRSTYIR